MKIYFVGYEKANWKRELFKLKWNFKFRNSFLFLTVQTDDNRKLPQTKKDDVLNFKQNLAKTNPTLYKNVENAEKHNRYERFLLNNRTRYTTIDEKKLDVA